MIQCIKTGFYASLAGGLFAHGDAFAISPFNFEWSDEPDHRPNACLLLRICSVSSETPSVIHFDLSTWGEWFDERRYQDVSNEDRGTARIYQPNSTLIASPGQWSWLGYDGKVPE